MSHTIEKKQRLFHSAVWQTLQTYYKKEAQAAWEDGETPEFISSNAFIANYYARIFHAFLQDTQPTSSTYLLDIGAGSGRFAYYFLKAYDALDPDKHYPIHYILCDFCQDNLSAHLNNPAFKPWIDTGHCDVAFLDATEELTTLTLQHQQKTITSDTLDSPLLVVTNYLLSSLPLDQLEIDEHDVRIAESTFSLSSKAKLDYTKSTVHLSYERALHPSDTPTATYFDRSLFPNNTHFPYRVRFPSGAFYLLDQLHTFSNHQLALLCSDMSHTNTSMACTPPAIEFTRKKGNIWFALDQSTLTLWHSQRGGEQYFFETHPHFFTALFVDGTPLKQLSSVTTLSQETTAWLTPVTVAELFYEEKYSSCTLLKALTVLQMDPLILVRKQDLIEYLINDSPYFKQTLADLLKTHHESIFLCNTHKNSILKTLGNLFFCVDNLPLCAHYLEQVPLTLRDPVSYWRLHTACQHLGKTTDDLPHFRKRCWLSQLWRPFQKTKQYWRYGFFKHPRLYLGFLVFAGLVGWFFFR